MEFGIPLIIGLLVGRIIFVSLMSDEFWNGVKQLKREKFMRKTRAHFKARNERIRNEYTAAVRSKIIREAEERRAAHSLKQEA